MEQQGGKAAAEPRSEPQHSQPHHSQPKPSQLQPSQLQHAEPQHAARPEDLEAGPEGQAGQHRQLLFVYGTLQRGCHNHHWLAQAQWLGRGCLDGVDLHDLGPFPMAIAGEGRLWGELYGVDDPLLAALDRFEGVPRLYRRVRLPLSDGRQAWIYLGTPRQVRHSPRLEQGRWPAPPAASVPGRQAGDPLEARSVCSARRQPEIPSRSATSQPPAPGALIAGACALQPEDRPQPPLRPRCRAMGPLLGIVALLGPLTLPPAARAEASLTLCQHWRSSSGQARILLGNAIGAASYLTKVHRLQESPPEAPVALYASSDLLRVCNSWR